MTTLAASRADAAHALMMMLTEHGDIPQPDEFELHEHESDAGHPDWGVVLVVNESLTRFEQWREALDLDPRDIAYRSCHHGACMSAIGEVHGVPVELFAVADIPEK
ncbi:hypothetical protein [Kitasatospora purpeofusca]|uniref:hypothetical protein n=1 Tax=Kitasatospora purpeofusca TaxID=67352 RepID=UPI002A5B07A3|nr:hypothetical protein [Kitasatospora purpeofusca]MDY0809900.1 hypothetical protein [Kitasatospora purpeofusca]